MRVEFEIPLDDDMSVREQAAFVVESLLEPIIRARDSYYESMLDELMLPEEERTFAYPKAHIGSADMLVRKLSPLIRATSQAFVAEAGKMGEHINYSDPDFWEDIPDQLRKNLAKHQRGQDGV